MPLLVLLGMVVSESYILKNIISLDMPHLQLDNYRIRNS